MAEKVRNETEKERICVRCGIEHKRAVLTCGRSRVAKFIRDRGDSSANFPFAFSSSTSTSSMSEARRSTRKKAVVDEDHAMEDVAPPAKQAKATPKPKPKKKKATAPEPVPAPNEAAEPAQSSESTSRRKRAPSSSDGDSQPPRKKTADIDGAAKNDQPVVKAVPEPPAKASAVDEDGDYQPEAKDEDDDEVEVEGNEFEVDDGDVEIESTDVSAPRRSKNYEKVKASLDAAVSRCL